PVRSVPAPAWTEFPRAPAGRVRPVQAAAAWHADSRAGPGRAARRAALAPPSRRTGQPGIGRWRDRPGPRRRSVRAAVDAAPGGDAVRLRRGHAPSAATTAGCASACGFADAAVRNGGEVA